MSNSNNNSDKTIRKLYLSPKEVEEQYGLSEKWLTNMRYEKRGIPYYKIGRKVLYKKTDVEAFIDRHKVRVITEW